LTILEKIESLPENDRNDYFKSLSNPQKNMILDKIIKSEVTKEFKEKLIIKYNKSIKDITFKMLTSHKAKTEEDIWYGTFLNTAEYEVDFNLEAPAATYYKKEINEFIIVINPKLFNVLLNITEQIPILKHEVGHIINNHFERILSKLKSSITETYLTNIAADLSINPTIPFLPDKNHILTPCLPEDFNLVNNKSLEYYKLELAKTKKLKEELEKRITLYNMGKSSHEYFIERSLEDNDPTKSKRNKVEEILHLIKLKSTEIKENLGLAIEERYGQQFTKSRSSSGSSEEQTDSITTKEKNIYNWKQLLKKYINNLKK
jgi:predicted metal-dependent peptidase